MGFMDYGLVVGIEIGCWIISRPQTAVEPQKAPCTDCRPSEGELNSV